MSCATHGEPALFSGWSARVAGAAPRRGVGLGRGRAGRPSCGCSSTSTAARSRRRRSRADLATEAGSPQPRSRPRRDGAPPARGGCGLYTGRIPDGLACLDEAMVRVIAGECTPIIAGHVYCTAIEGCQEISDFGRVAEWTAALEHGAPRSPDCSLFTGQCALHRGQLFRRCTATGRRHSTSSRSPRSATSRPGRRMPSGSRPASPATSCACAGTSTGPTLPTSVRPTTAATPTPGSPCCGSPAGRTLRRWPPSSACWSRTSTPWARCRILPAAVEVLLASGHVDRARVCRGRARRATLA